MFNSSRFLGAVFLLLFVTAIPVFAQGNSHVMKSKPAIAVSATFDAEGRLWRVRAEDNYLLVDRSDNFGKSFTNPAKVNSEPEKIAAEGEARPDIAIASNGNIYVTWSMPLPTPYTGHIRFARSTDGGRTFATPLIVNDNRDEITHRFQTMYVAPDGRIFIAWIDKRDGVAAKKAGQSFAGASIFYAVSENEGVSFLSNRKHAAHSCECCRLAIAGDIDGVPVLFWRHVFGDGTRDHALARLGSIAEKDDIARATDEHWKIEACPHHGPALSIAKDGTRHLTWFSMINGNGVLRYQAFKPDGTSVVKPLSYGGEQAAHPALLVLDNVVLLAWKEFDGRQTRIQVMRSKNNGKDWVTLPSPAFTVDASDNPMLLAYNGSAYLSWNTLKDGYKLIELEEGKDGR